MPEVCRFYGIVIRMYFQQKEHNPPHFHAIYGDHVVAVNIITGEIIEGFFPPKALSMVKEWSALHKNELMKIWDTQEFAEILPLL